MPDLNYVIVEDESATALRLNKLVKDINPLAQHIKTLETVEEAIEWFSANNSFDLIFMDIQLADGISFDIFKEVEISTPVIFVTAYDNYALQAFKSNGLDYILKPVKKEELQIALDKFQKLQTKSQLDYLKIAELLQQQQSRSYQKRFLLKIGEVFNTIDIKEIAYFYALEKTIIAKLFNTRDYPLDYNLDQLENLLDPKQFFRINRQYLINIQAIQTMHAWSKSRIKITLNPPSANETVVSTYRTLAFKEWLESK